MLNQNREPLPSSDSTPMLPPNFSAIMAQIGSPKPVPWANVFSLTKRSKILSFLLLLQLINDIIDMAKIESGSLDFTYSQIDINELMEEICSQMILKNKSEAVSISFDEKLPQCLIYTDRNRLMQVICLCQ